MRTSSYFIATLKEAPVTARLPSHQLMLQAGLIRQVAAGLYTWMPLGFKVTQKITAVVREELNAIGALELLMPTIQPAELWQQSARWEQYGKELLKIKDRNNRDFCFGPTHEEVITDLIKGEIKSYKQLPCHFYQIQVKFRDEIRPRFGVMRSREFIMKDGYSFHADKTSLHETYLKVYAAYSRIFTRLGLIFKPVAADNGSIGGQGSYEFQVLADNGEDTIAFCPQSDYAANIELAPTLRLDGQRRQGQKPLTLVATPGVVTIAGLVDFLNLNIKQTVKAIVVAGQKPQCPVLLLLRGDHEFNETKVSKLDGIGLPLTLADAAVVKDIFGAGSGSLGPVGFQGKIYADYALELDNDWVVGANKDGYHYSGFNFGRDGTEPEFADIRNVVAGDCSPDGKGQLTLARGIEVGHIFELGTKYSQALSAVFLDQNGKRQVLEMGCYGIGITRIVAAAIEQSHDDKGIIWSRQLAPFVFVIVPLNFHKSERVQSTSEKIYAELSAAGQEVLLDDRHERAGVLLNDAELLGFPYRIVIGDKGLDAGVVEVQERHGRRVTEVAVGAVVNYLLQL